MTDDLSTPSPPPEPSPEEPVAVASRSRHIGRAGIVMLIAGALILVVGVAVFAIAVTGAGGKAVAAEAVPPDVDLYVSIDFVNLREVAPIYDAFVTSLDRTGTPAEDLLDELDRELDAEFGVTLDDLIAWLGRDAAIGVRDLDAGADFDAIPDIVATVSIDDNAKAEEFISAIRARIESEEGVVFRQSQHEGVTVYAADGPTTDVAAYAMLDEILIMASTADMVEDSIDAYFGESISDVTDFQDTIAALPGSRAFTMYVNPQLMADLTDIASGMQGAIGQPGLDDVFAGVRGFGMSAGAIAEGMRFDMALVTDPDSFDESQLTSFDFEGGAGFEDHFPRDTVIYFGAAAGLAEAWDSATAELESSLESALGPDAGSLDELMGMANDQLGFDLERDLIDHLDGPMGFAVVDSVGGLLAEGFGFDMGIVGAFGVSDTAALQTAIEGISELLVQGGMERSRVEVAGGDFYAGTIDGTEAVAFGAGNGFMMVATDGKLISDFFDEGQKLADNTTYQMAASALGGDSPAMFVDITALLEMFDAPADARQGLRPLLGAAADGRVTPSLSTATLVVVIETAG